MTIGVGDLLDLAISPEIGPVNFFHLRNLLHTLVEHFDISDIDAQQAEVKAPGGQVSSNESSSEESSEEEDSESEEESESDGEPEIQIIEEEVEKVVIDEDGNEKKVMVTIQKEVIKEPSEKKKDGESKKKNKDKGKDDTGKDKEKSVKKDKKNKDKSKSEKDGDEKEGKKSSKKDKEKPDGGSVYGKDMYGKDSKKDKKKLTADTIGDMPEVVNLTRRLDAVENGLKGLRNIVDSMVNQVDFGDGVGEILKAQLDQVQQQITTVELIPKEEPKESKKKKKGKKGNEEVPQTGIITEGGAAVGGLVAEQASVGAGGVVTSAPGAPAVASVLPAVIPPPSQRAAADAGRMPSRKEGREAGIPMQGASGNRPESQGGEKPAPLKKRTTLRDLQIRKKAREEGVSIEEIEARETEKESTGNKDEKDPTDPKDPKDPKDKKDDDADDTSSIESLDSEEEQAAMDEMIREEIEAALEHAADDPEAQAYALRLSLEQMNNMKKSITQSHDEFRKDMDKNKLAISQIAKDLSLFRAARKAQDAEGFNAVHHVHSMVLELQSKHEKITATTTELVNEYNRREKTFEELAEKVERLQQNKADKQDVNHEINVKADKMDLEAKVSMNQFDEGFNLLDRGLSDALEKMETQMSVEDALKATLTELQSKLSLKLDRDELDNLKSQLESRIKEIQITKTVVREKPDEGEPAGFRRNITEKVHCISCDRPLEVNKGPVHPNMPKIQGLPSHKSSKPYTTYELEAIRQHSKMNNTLRKAVINADLPYSAQKLRTEVVAMTGMVDLIDLPTSQRYCGGSHTIMHPFRRSIKSTSTHFNQYVMIRDDVETNVALPRRDFIVPKESQLKKYMKPKLPAIGQANTREPSPPLDYEEGYQDRPSSAPATPGLYSNTTRRDRSQTSPYGDITVPMSPPPRENGNHSPIEVDRISVTLPSPVEEA